MYQTINLKAKYWGRYKSADVAIHVKLNTDNSLSREESKSEKESLTNILIDLLRSKCDYSDIKLIK